MAVLLAGGRYISKKRDEWRIKSYLHDRFERVRFRVRVDMMVLDKGQPKQLLQLNCDHEYVRINGWIKLLR